MSHSRQKSDVGALFALGTPRHYNKYFNNSVNKPNFMDLDRPSGTKNSVAETTSTVFCAVLEFRMNGVTSEAQGNGLVCVGAWRGSEYATRTWCIVTCPACDVL